MKIQTPPFNYIGVMINYFLDIACLQMDIYSKNSIELTIIRLFREV